MTDQEGRLTLEIGPYLSGCIEYCCQVVGVPLDAHIGIVGVDAPVTSAMATVVPEQHCVLVTEVDGEVLPKECTDPDPVAADNERPCSYGSPVQREAVIGLGIAAVYEDIVLCRRRARDIVFICGHGREAIATRGDCRYPI